MKYGLECECSFSYVLFAREARDLQSALRKGCGDRGVECLESEVITGWRWHRWALHSIWLGSCLLQGDMAKAVSLSSSGKMGFLHKRSPHFETHDVRSDESTEARFGPVAINMKKRNIPIKNLATPWVSPTWLNGLAPTPNLEVI